MKKRLLCTVVALLLALLCAAPAFASPSLLVDSADLLTDAEEAQLLETLEEISLRRAFDVVVVTVPDMGSMSAFEYAAAVYENYGYGQGESLDGTLFLISMAERECYIIGSGRGETQINDSVIDTILDNVIYDLSYGDYLSAFTVYAQMVDSYLDAEPYGELDNVIVSVDDSSVIYDYDPYPSPYVRRFNAVRSGGISLAIGFVAGIITVSVMKGKMKTVRQNVGADNYTRRGSMRLSRSRDIFLYRKVDRRRKPEQNRSYGGGGGGVHISSSGHSYSGGGRKF